MTITHHDAIDVAAPPLRVIRGGGTSTCPQPERAVAALLVALGHHQIARLVDLTVPLAELIPSNG